MQLTRALRATADIESPAHDFLTLAQDSFSTRSISIWWLSHGEEVWADCPCHSGLGTGELPWQVKYSHFVSISRTCSFAYLRILKQVNSGYHVVFCTLANQAFRVAAYWLGNAACTCHHIKRYQAPTWAMGVRCEPYWPTNRFNGTVSLQMAMIPTHHWPYPLYKVKLRNLNQRFKPRFVISSNKLYQQSPSFQLSTHRLSSISLRIHMTLQTCLPTSGLTQIPWRSKRAKASKSSCEVLALMSIG